MSAEGVKALQAVLPVGLNAELSISKVKVYCPRCHTNYVPRGQRSTFATGSKGCKLNLDGAFFGPSFPFVFLLNLQSEQDVIPQSAPADFKL